MPPNFPTLQEATLPSKRRQSSQSFFSFSFGGGLQSRPFGEKLRERAASGDFTRQAKAPASPVLSPSAADVFKSRSLPGAARLHLQDLTANEHLVVEEALDRIVEGLEDFDLDTSTTRTEFVPPYSEENDDDTIVEEWDSDFGFDSSLCIPISISSSQSVVKDSLRAAKDLANNVKALEHLTAQCRGKNDSELWREVDAVIALAQADTLDEDIAEEGIQLLARLGATESNNSVLKLDGAVLQTLLAHVCFLRAQVEECANGNEATKEKALKEDWEI